MNIVEAYIKFKPGLVIFVSGLSGCGKTTLAKKLSKKFGLPVVDQFNFYKKGWDEKYRLPNDEEVINWHSDDAIQWEEFNQKIAELKDKGVVVTGFSFPTDNMDVVPDYHIHLSMSKQKCMDKRRDFLEKHKDKYPKEYEELETPTEKLKMNRLIFPYYLESRKKMKIDKFLNVENLSSREIYHAVFDELMDFIEKYLYEERPQAESGIQKMEKDDESEKPDEFDKVKDGPIQFLYYDENNQLIQ